MMASYTDTRVGRAFVGSAKTANKIKLNIFEENDFFGTEISSISLKEEEALKKASEAKSENDEALVQKKQKN